MILVSTGGFKGTSAYKTALKFIENGINCIELSGGAYETVEFWKYQELSEIANLKIHNYFPPPEVPFVFNLASKDPVIAEKSILHARNAIRFSASVGGSIYSFHAGFLLDPKVDDLGQRLYADCLYEEVMYEPFLERVSTLADYAGRLNVQLLIENNVISDEISNYLVKILF